MPAFGQRSRGGTALQVGDVQARFQSDNGTPRDVEALISVIEAVEGAPDLMTALERATRTLVAAADLSYGSVWVPDGAGGLRLVHEEGQFAGQVDGALQPGGPILRTLQNREMLYIADLGAHADSPRAQRAHSLGLRSAMYFPFTTAGSVVAVLELYSGYAMGLDAGRVDKLKGIGRIADLAIANVMAQAQLQQVADDRLAVTKVVGEMARARDDHEAARIALDTVRDAFGWAYGSFWRIDERDNLLHFELESGSAGPEFRKVTLAATFAEGVGLSGRAWKARDLVFVPNLADLADCVRAPSAGRAGVKSGICFPVMAGERVIGTMDFFQTQTIELSESRASALRNVQQLVSQRIESLSRNAVEEENARALLETVSQLREAATDAQQVANEAVHRAGTMTGEVDDLGSASSAIGDVIKIISSIADQTNLLALNATIEAARAGDVGKGFAVVASEVKELARETAQATSQVAEQIQAIQTNTRSVSNGIHATSEIIGRMDSVQARINDVLETQAAVAARLEGVG